MKLANLIYGYLPPHPPVNFKAFRKYLAFEKLFEGIGSGSVVECGAGEGWSLMLLTYCMRQETEKRGGGGAKASLGI